MTLTESNAVDADIFSQTQRKSSQNETMWIRSNKNKNRYFT